MDEHGNIDQTTPPSGARAGSRPNNGPGQTLQRFMGLFDTIQLGLVTPIDDESFHLRFCFIQKRDLNPAQQAMAKALTDEISRQVEQDIPIWNHKIYQPQPILCDGDGPIAQFRRWFSQFYAPVAGGDTLQVRAAS